ncbi:MAG: class I SAM-dependent methyltransferase [Bacteroidetes bacterium]|nr:MAG: class I SAM-dependent methyltransferase [Bacteroidota bacterium]
MHKDPWYQEWFDSPYYQILYFQHNLAEAKQFIENLLTRIQPRPGSFVLDVACGRGRHSRILESRGFDVTGIDLSESSIQFARQFENEHLHFFRHDMRLPFWMNYFDLAFNLFTSFGYFESTRENENVIRTIANSLRKDSMLVLDYLNVHYAMAHLVAQEEKIIEGVLFKINRWYDEKFFYKRIEVIPPDKSQPQTFTEKVRKFYFGDFNEMFSYRKLQVIEIFGDYSLNPFNKNESPRLVLLAKKYVH